MEFTDPIINMERVKYFLLIRIMYCYFCLGRPVLISSNMLFLTKSVPVPGPVCWGSVLQMQTRLQIPAKCLTVQLNSDALYVEIATDLTGKGLSPTRPPPCQTPTASLGCHLCFWPTASKLEIPNQDANHKARLFILLIDRL